MVILCWNWNCCTKLKVSSLKAGYCWAEFLNSSVAFKTTAWNSFLSLSCVPTFTESDKIRSTGTCFLLYWDGSIARHSWCFCFRNCKSSSNFTKDTAVPNSFPKSILLPFHTYCCYFTTLTKESILQALSIRFRSFTSAWYFLDSLK